MKLPIYLDYAATTPVDPQVAEQMMQYLTLEGHFGNPASLSHAFGKSARDAVEYARGQVAAILNAEPTEIIWTSGATEADNLALKGAAQLYQRKGKHIVTLKTEHKAVLDTCQELEKSGFQVTYLTPDENGFLSPEKFQQALREDTILVSIMQVNNETGVIQDVHALAKITSARHILFHVDAAQSGAKMILDVQKTPVDLVSLCAHKMYGPKGVGALYVRRKPRVRVAAQIHGGGQEHGMRSGTLATHQIVGMGKAAEVALVCMQNDFEKLSTQRQVFINILSSENMRINAAVNTYPGILNICFPGIPAETLIQACPDIAFSAGSACDTKGIEPSYVLRAMGLSAYDAACSVRFSFGRFTTLAEVTYAAEKIKRLLPVLKKPR